MHFKTLALGLFLIAPSLLLAVFVGPPSSSAGVVERQIEKEGESKEIETDKEIPLLEIEIPKQQLDLGGNRSIHVDGIAFEGNTIFSQSDLQKLIDTCIHCNVSMTEIGKICLKIQQKYVDAGYFLARVFPPEQEVSAGILKIRIMEGVLGNISIVGNRHYKQSFIKKYFRNLKNKPINYNQFIRSLLLLNEHQDLDVAAVFKKGELPGTADLVLRVADKRPIHLYADVNNYGSRITSLYRAGSRFDYGNTLFQGDMLSLAGVVGMPVKDLRFADAIYRVPLNSIGTHMELSYLYSDFRVNAMKALHLHGRSGVGTLKVDHALLRTKPLNLDVYGSFQYVISKNLSFQSTISNDKLPIAGVGSRLDYLDSCQGRNLFETTLYVGIPHFLGGLKAIDPRCSRVGAGSRFVFLELDYKRLQKLPADCFLLFNFSGQGTTYKLPLAEQIFIGGIDTVRGFPLAIGLGDNGYYTNLEARVPIPWGKNARVPGVKKKWKEFFQIVGFVDHGGVFLNGGGEDQKHSIILTSGGVGARIYGPYRFDVSFDAGFPLSQDQRGPNCIYYFKVNWRVF